MFCMLMHALHGDHDGHQTAAHHANESLLDILKRRYAQGEITGAQFEQMKRVLNLADSPATPPTVEHKRLDA